MDLRKRLRVRYYLSGRQGDELNNGAMAQLVARFHGMEEVGGSNPPSSTIKAGASCTGLFRFLAYRPTFGVLRNIPRKASPRGRSSDWRDTGVSDNSNRHYNEVWSLSC